MKKINIITLMVGIIVMAATASVWCLAYSSLWGGAMFWLTLCTLLGLELATTVLYGTTKDDPRLFARAVAFLLETILMAVASVLYLNLFRDAVESYLILLICATAICAVFGIWLTANYRENCRKDAGTQQSRELIWRCRDVVSILQCSDNAKKHREQLDLLEEDLRYALAGVTTGLDEQIYQKLCALTEAVRNDEADVNDRIADVRQLLRRRREQISR